MTSQRDRRRLGKIVSGIRHDGDSKITLWLHCEERIAIGPLLEVLNTVR
jgi:hypothetical protein